MYLQYDVSKGQNDRLCPPFLGAAWERSWTLAMLLRKTCVFALGVATTRITAFDYYQVPNNNSICMSMRPLALLSLLLLVPVWADTSSHRYKEGEHIELWVNKVGKEQRPS
jgi:hypothetical protein